jgi:GT2 family glycosyltransferase
MTQPDISVVVCTRNRAALLREALASLYDLATGEFAYEIVVIDNGSTDETQAVITQAATQAKHPLRGVYEPQPGIVAARNRGTREAAGRWIAFFDDDQLADWHWLAELFRTAAEKKCRIVGGAVQLALPTDCTRNLAPTVRMLLGESMGGELPQRYGGRLTPGCGNMMIERSVFDEVGQFEAAIDGRGEDTDFFERACRARIDAWYVPTAIIHHLTPAERLERAYLLDLAERMGRGIGLRRRKALGVARFGCLWLAKAVRVLAVDYPLLIWAGLRGNAEVTLGRRCQLTISQGYLNGACDPTPSLPKLDRPLEQPPAPVPSESAMPAAKAAVAPAFTVRPAEPTAVMEFPSYGVAPSAPSVPFER